MAEVCEGSTQGRLVWAGGRQAFSERPHEMVGGRLGHGSGACLQACGGHSEWQAVGESSVPDFLPACPLRFLATVLSAPVPVPPDLCIKLTHIPSFLVSTLLLLDAVALSGQTPGAISVCARLYPRTLLFSCSPCRYLPYFTLALICPMKHQRLICELRASGQPPPPAA